MPRLTPDQTFYPSPSMAMTATPETMAYVTMLNADPREPDALAVVDVDSNSANYGQLIGRVDMPQAGDELHHFGWNACSSCLCPSSPHPHMERRYLIVPGMRSSRIHILDTKPDPRQPRVVKVIEAEEVGQRTGYSRPHTTHCGPDGIYVNALGSIYGGGPGGIFVLDPETFDVRGKWECERGPQQLSYDFWWHLGHDVMITSEWGTPNMVEDGVNPELLLGGKYGHALHLWDMRTRKHKQALDLGAEQQMVLELRPAHNPTETYGFVGVVTSLKDLSASVWLWYREGKNGNGQWKIRKVIEIPAEPAPAAQLPDLLKGFGAVPPLVTDINLSLDDRFLYVSCWGTGELRQYRRERSLQPSADRQPADRRHREAHAASAAARRAAEWRTADGRSEPRWPASLSDQLALPQLGRAVLSRWDSRLDGQDRCPARGRHRVRQQIPAEDRRPPTASSTPAGWRRFVRLLLLCLTDVPGKAAPLKAQVHVMDGSSVGLLALGAFHGLNPGMGWLFAVALGMQEGRRSAVYRALLPLAAGHVLAIAAALAVAVVAGAVLPMRMLQWTVAALLFGFGVSRFFTHGHPRWVGMQVGAGDLTLWSFLMASAHGAGLMVLPLVLGGDAAHCQLHADGAGAWSAALATLTHSAGYLAVSAALAALVFEKLGVGLLRKAWLNLDLIWAVALVATGLATLAS